MYQTKTQPFLDKLVTESDFNPSNEIYPNYFGVGWTKVYIEKMCEFYSRLGRTTHCVIRHSNVYGPYDKYGLDDSHVFGATLNKVLNQENNEVNIWGDGLEERDLLYIDDLVESVNKLIIFDDIKEFCLLNIGSGIAISIKDLVEKIIYISGLNNKKISFDNSKPTVKTSVSLDCSLAKSMLNWEPQTSLDDGIKKTISWYKNTIDV